MGAEAHGPGLTECKEDSFKQRRNRNSVRKTKLRLRQAGFWVGGGNRQVKSVTGRCVTCKRLTGSLGMQQMGQLPAVRVEHSAPFTHFGIDCFGPFHLNGRCTKLLRYGLRFTCMYSRAVHLEVLDNMSTDSFINALRCFLCIRREVHSMYCDNGTNFVRVNNEFVKLLTHRLIPHSSATSQNIT